MEKVIPSRRERLLLVLSEIEKLPPFRNGLQVYKELSERLNHQEDCFFGKESWDPPRTFLENNRTDRLYPIYPESIHTIEEFPGVSILISMKEIIFISRWGAIEVQDKDPKDKYGQVTHFFLRKEKVIFYKSDYYGHGVWADKNKE
jgi:hypothetical protein